MLLCEHCNREHDEAHNVCPVTGKLFRPERLFPPGLLLEGKYRLEGVLGSGGMGAVFRARHTLLEKTVAVKVTLPELAADEQVAARMVREARAASATGHPNVAAVTDMGWLESGGMFLVMEYLEGETLTQISAREGPMPYQRAAKITCQILSGLGAVHALGVVHRDLKPANVMVVHDHDGAEVTKILDFGISKMLDEDRALELTQTGVIMGSPRYMSPEQACGTKNLDHRVDIYAAGGILYSLLVGQPPLSAPNYHAMLAVILEGKISAPSERVPGIPKLLDDIVLRAMARQPAERYANVAEFRQALEPLCGEVGDDGCTVSERSRGPNALLVDSEHDSFANISDDSLVTLDGAISDGFTSNRGGATEHESVDALNHRMAVGSHPELPAVGNSGGAGQPTPHRAARGAQNPGSYAQGVSPAGAPLSGGLAAQHSRPAAVRDSARTPQPIGGPPDDEALELDVDLSWQKWSEPARENPRAYKPAASAEVVFPGEKRDPWRWVRIFFTVLLVVGIAGGGWYYWENYVSTDVVEQSAESSVLILVETSPADAEIYVDGVLQVSKPVQLPRSDQYFSIRVSAPGYRSKRLRIKADRTRTVSVALVPD